MKYWEIIADRLSHAGWSWGYTALIDSAGQRLFNVDAHRDDGGRYIVRADELLTAFLELERLVNGWNHASLRGSLAQTRLRSYR